MYFIIIIPHIFIVREYISELMFKKTASSFVVFKE